MSIPKSSRSSRISNGDGSSRRPLMIMVFAGIVVSLIVIGVIIDQINRSRQEPAKSSDEPAAVAGSIDAITSVSELRSMYEAIDRRINQTSLPAREDLLSQQKQICRRIVAVSKNADDREFADAMHINAQARWFAMRSMNQLSGDDVRNELQLMIDANLNDPRRAVARQANLALLAVAFADLTSAPESMESLEALNTAVREVTEKFRDDVEVIANLDSVLGVLLSTGTFKEAMPSILTNLYDCLKDSQNDKSLTLALKAHDERILRQAEYPLVLSGLYNGRSTAKEEFLEIVKLAKGNNASLVAWQRIVSDVRLLEGNGWYDEARATYSEIWDLVNSGTVRSVASPELAKAILADCANGLKRLDAVNKPFDFSGIDFRKQPIDPAQFKGQVVWLAFFRNVDSVTDFRRLMTQARALSARGRLQVAFVFSSLPADFSTKHAEGFLWNNSTVLLEPGFQGEFSKQLPVNYDAYFAIVDSEGIVNSIGTLDRQVATKLETLLFRAVDASGSGATSTSTGGGDQSDD